MAEHYRLVTRSDFDGLACAVLLKEQGLIDEIVFAHPKDVQDGTFAITDRDITTNLPYAPACHLAFDHHASETVRVGDDTPANLILDPDAGSAARVVYNHYGGRDAFPTVALDLMEAVDRADSADFTFEEVLHPQGWVLLNFLMDARTGLGRFREFAVSNYQLMMELIDYCRAHTIDEILELPHVKERVDLYLEHKEPFQEQVKRCSKVYGKTVVLDLRREETIYAGNRFLIYALHPECTVSIHVLWGKNKQNTVFAMGKSIFDRSARVHIGELALSYGGGGHGAAGTCQVDNDTADTVLQELIDQIGHYG